MASSTKRRVPQHLVDRMAALTEQRAAIENARVQLLQDFAGFLGVNPEHSGIWFNSDEDPPTYEVLPRGEVERRARLKEAAANGGVVPKPGESPLELVRPKKRA